MKKNKNLNMSIHKLCLIGLMAALVFISTFFSIQIPIPGLNVMIHLGNVFCILSALLLGPISGGCAAGIGSFFYDLTNPLYISSAPFTLIFKFIMGFICGKIAYNNKRNAEILKYNIIGASAGLLAYIILHLFKTFIKNLLLGVDLNLNLLLIGQSSLVSLFNAFLAILIAIPLSAILKKALNKSNLI